MAEHDCTCVQIDGMARNGWKLLKMLESLKTAGRG